MIKEILENLKANLIIHKMKASICPLHVLFVCILIALLVSHCHGVVSVPKFVKLLPNKPSENPQKPATEHNSERQSRYALIKESGKGFVDKWKNRVQGNGIHLLQGSKSFGLQLKKAAELKLHQVQNGKHSISYEEFHYIEQAGADLGKAVRKLGWSPFGKRYVFMSTVVFPLFSSNHLATFKDFPTTFLNQKDQNAREDILIKRRMQAAMYGLYTLQEGQTLDDVARNEANAQHARLVESALLQRNLSHALNLLDPLLIKHEHSVRRAPAVGLAALPSALVKQCLQALGAASVPNFPVLRLLNTLSLKNRVNGIRRSDEFLVVKGVTTLSAEEVKLACFERCIRTEDRPEGELRSDLSEWLQLVHPTPHLGVAEKTPDETVTRLTARRPGESHNTSLTLDVLIATTNGTALSTVSATLGNNNTTITISPDVASVSTPSSSTSHDPFAGDRTLLTSGREALQKATHAMKEWRDSTKKAAVLATNAQNKRFALLALHALKNLKASSFGGVYRAALLDSQSEDVNKTPMPK